MDLRERFESELLPHLRSLYGTAHRMARNSADAEDLVQETLTRAWSGLDRLVPGSNARAWLHTILQRVRTDAWRRRSRRPELVELTGPEPASPHSPAAVAAAGLDVERALLGLPETYRAAVVLRDLEGFSYQEIAEILGVALGTVMSRIHRGRALLREALSGTAS
jgi:RNA polymerase sigma-70 factor (ECF subfamily)